MVILELPASMAALVSTLVSDHDIPTKGHGLHEMQRVSYMMYQDAAAESILQPAAE